MRKITSSGFNPNGPETKYQRRSNDAQVYPFEIPNLGGSANSTRMKVLFGRFKVREGELRSEKISEEKSMVVSLPAHILLTSTALPKEEKISIFSDADEIASAAIEGIEFFRTKLVEMEGKPGPRFGINFGEFLEEKRSGKVADEDDKSRMAEKIARMKNACLIIEDDSISSLPDLAVVFPSSELPKMIGMVGINVSTITFTDFDNNDSTIVNYNKDRHARLTNPISALLLMKAMVSFE